MLSTLHVVNVSKASPSTMFCREQLKQRFLTVLSDPKLPKDSILQDLKTALAPNTEALVTHIFLLFFGGLETIPSMICGLFWHFQQQPKVWQKVREGGELLLVRSCSTRHRRDGPGITALN